MVTEDMQYVLLYYTGLIMSHKQELVSTLKVLKSFCFIFPATFASFLNNHAISLYPRDSFTLTSYLKSHRQEKILS